MRDITERKRAEEEKAMRIEQLERELHSLDRIYGSSQTAVSAQTFESEPFQKSFPEKFNDLVRRYRELMDLALEQRAYKVENDISEALRTMAEQIGFLKLSAREVIEIHSAAIKKIIKGVAPQKAQAYAEEGRLMVLELMGHLNTYYRNISLNYWKASDHGG